MAKRQIERRKADGEHLEARLDIRLTRDEAASLRALADTDKRTLSSLLRLAISEYIERRLA